MKKIGIYGGTFDPPHLGHRNAARAALESLGLDELIFVPASTPPHKILPEEAATAEQRLEMTRLMADGMGDPRVHVSDLEVRRGGTSYTAQSLRQLRQEHPELKVAWYSGRQRVPTTVRKADFDYIKLGPYIAHLGCLRERTTNQRLYKRASGDDFTDITSRFWK